MIEPSHTKRPRLTIMAISLGVFASVMSTTMLSIAFVDVARSLQVTYATLQWRNGVFFSFFAVGLPFFGKLADRVGLRRQFFFGIALFVASSLLSGLTRSWPLFLVFQALQGLADAMIVPALMGLIGVLFPPERTGWAFGWFGGVLAVATFIAPLLGGFVVQYAAWPVIFYCLSGIGLVCLISSALVLPRVAPPPERPAGRLPGWAALTLLAVVFCAQGVGTMSGLARLVLVVALALTVAIFMYLERTADAASTLLPRGALGNAVFLIGCVRAFLLYLGSSGVGLFAPSYLRQVHGLSADVVGRLLLVEPLLALPLSMWAGRAADHRPYLAIAAGLGLSVGGCLAFLGTLDPPMPWYALGASYVLLGLGSTLAMPALDKIALLSVPKNESAHYMGTFQMVQFGTGAFAGVLFGPLAERGGSGLPTAEGFACVALLSAALLVIGLGTVFLERHVVSRKQVSSMDQPVQAE
ncbi:MFS transporter [Sorangium sp. So ce693]|uniref:MFS transporter n=1 Tax=Sorangium sp. So ce693 TaxID=3133318 RepID=UPI003F62F32C